MKLAGARSGEALIVWMWPGLPIPSINAWPLGNRVMETIFKGEVHCVNLKPPMRVRQSAEPEGAAA